MCVCINACANVFVTNAVSCKVDCDVSQSLLCVISVNSLLLLSSSIIELQKLADIRVETGVDFGLQYNSAGGGS